MTTRTRRTITALAALTLALTACGDHSPASTESSPAASDSLADTVSTVADTAAAEAVDAFPVTVTAGDGEVTIEARPERIVVMSASLTETVFAVGAGEQVIAVDSYSNHPVGVPTTDLSGFRPNVEAIGALEPDLVLVSRDSDDIVATLGEVGIQALLLPSARSLDDVYAQIDTVGSATGHAQVAATLTAQMRSDIDSQFGRLAGVSVPVTFFYEMSDDYKTLTSDTFVGSILAEIGMVNIADGVDPSAGAYPQLSAEYVLEADPEQLIIAHTGGSVPTLGDLASRPGWSTLRAIADGNVTFLDTEIASRWGPRVVDLVTEIVDGLVGES